MNQTLCEGELVALLDPTRGLIVRNQEGTLEVQVQVNSDSITITALLEKQLVDSAPQSTSARVFILKKKQETKS